MNFRKTLIATAITLAAGFASADNFDFVIPSVGTGPAENGGQWQSDVTIHNAGHELLLLKLSYHDATGELTAIDLPMPGRTTKTLPDIVKNDFGRENSTGAIVVDTDDILRNKLSITSRTFNGSATGELGRNNPALTETTALAPGDTGILNGPSNATANRFDFGVFAATKTTIEWRLLRRDGSVAKSVEQTYEAGTHAQFSTGVETLFGETSQDDDVVHARVRTGRAWIFGTVVNEQSGDPSYVPSGRTRENLLPRVLGIDTTFDGVADFGDSDRNGILDKALTVSSGHFSVGFRVIASDPEGSALTYSIVNNDGNATLIDTRGRVSWWPGAILKGTTGKLVLRVSDGTDSVDFTIPANFN